MREASQGALVALAVLMVCWSGSPRSSAAAPGSDAQACSLLMKSEAEKITGRPLYRDPEAMGLTGGSVCDYGTAQVILFSGEGSGERLEALLKSFGHDRDERHPVSGVGEGAYVIYPEPRNQYQDTVAFLVTKVGPHTVAVSLAAEEGKPAESVQPAVVALAKAVVAKLP